MMVNQPLKAEKKRDTLAECKAANTITIVIYSDDYQIEIEIYDPCD